MVLFIKYIYMFSLFFIHSFSSVIVLFYKWSSSGKLNSCSSSSFSDVRFWKKSALGVVF